MNKSGIHWESTKNQQGCLSDSMLVKYNIIQLNLFKLAWVSLLYSAHGMYTRSKHNLTVMQECKKRFVVHKTFILKQNIMASQ